MNLSFFGEKVGIVGNLKSSLIKLYYQGRIEDFLIEGSNLQREDGFVNFT